MASAMLAAASHGVARAAAATLRRAPVAAALSAAAFSTAAPKPNMAIDVSALQFTQTTKPKAKLPNDMLVFGATMTDHILEVDYTAERGWHAPTIKPYHALELDPAAAVLHYGLEAFEGLKAYRKADGSLCLFRPDLNMRRLAGSMRRIAMPALDEAGFLACIKEFVRKEASWVPAGEGFSLYLRPTVIATWPYLGVAEAKAFKLYTIACPVGPYYKHGFKPVKLLAESTYSRAWPGGTGEAKVGGNYAPTIMVQAAAAAKGYDQVLWLAGERREVTEVGTMNFFVLWKNAAGERELVTAPLDGTILAGVTRASVLELARGWGEFKVSERPYTMAELVEAAKAGRVLEAFGAGTAVVVSPVKSITYNGAEYAIPLNPDNAAAGAGPLTQRVWDSLLAIQYGRVPGHPWCVPV